MFRIVNCVCLARLCPLWNNACAILILRYTSFEDAKKTTCLSIKSVHMSQPTSFSLLLDSFCLHSHYLSISLVCVSSRFLFQQKQPRSIEYRHVRLLMRGCTIHSNGPLLVVIANIDVSASRAGVSHDAKGSFVYFHRMACSS